MTLLFIRTHSHVCLWASLQVPENAVLLGQSITKSSQPTPHMGTPTDQELERGLALQKAKNQDAVEWVINTNTLEVYHGSVVTAWLCFVSLLGIS